MRYFLGLYLFIISITLSAQSLDNFYAQAVEDYYNFQYTSAVNGFQQVITKGNTGDQQKLIKSYYYLSMSCFELDRINDALDYLFEGSGIAIEKFGEESAESADFYTGYGKLYHYNESYDTAKLFYQSALEMKSIEKEPVVIAEIYANLGYACDYLGEYDSALIFYKQAAIILERELGKYHPYTDWVYASMPFVASNSHNYTEEVNTALKSLEIKLKLWGEGTDDHRSALLALAIAYEHVKDAGNQKNYFTQALSLTDKLYGNKSEEYALNLSQLGNAYAALNKTEEARDYNMQAYALMRKLFGDRHPKTLDLLRNIGNVLYDGGRYQEAKTYYEQHLTFQLKRVGKSSVELIQPYEDMAQVSENIGSYDMALEYYLKSKALKTGNYELDIPKSFIAIARVMDAQGKNSEALKYLDEAMIANLKFNDGDLGTKAFIENNIGTIYNQLGDYEKALDYLEESLEARLRIFGEDSKESVQTKTNIANVHYRQGRYNEAKVDYQKIVSIKEILFGENHPEVAESLVNLANAYSKLGEYLEEIEALKRAEEIQRSANGDSHVGLISIFHNLVIGYSNLANYSEALAYSKKHEILVIQLYGDDSEQMADNLNALGIVKHGMGNTNEAFKLYKQALAIYKSIEPIDRLDLATVYNNLGVSYLDYQEFTQAKEYLLEAIRLYLQVLDENHPEVITTKMNLGLVEYGKSNYPDAIEIFNNTLKTGQNSELKDSLLIATIYQNRALAELMNDDIDASLASTNEALKIRKNILGERSIMVAELMVNAGNLYLKQRSFDQAILNFENARAILENEFASASTISKIKLNLSLAAANSDQGNLVQALKYAQLALKENKNEEGTESSVLYFIAQVQLVDIAYLSFIKSDDTKYLAQASKYLTQADAELVKAEREILNDVDRLEFGIWKSLMTNVGIKNALAKYAVSGAVQDKEEAFYFAERSKSNVLISALKESNVNALAGVDEKLLTRDREIKFATQRLNELIFKEVGHADKEKQDRLSEQLFVLKREQEKVLAELRSNKQYTKVHSSLEIITLADIQNKMDNGQAVVEFAAGDSTLHTFVITKNSFEVFSKKYDEKFDQLVTAIRNAIIFKSNTAVEFVGNRLYDLLMKDVENYFIKNKLEIADITIVPEGSFNYFPFESLKRNGKYLIEDFDIHYQYSMTLSSVIEETTNTKKNNAMLAFAPVFSDPNNNTLTSGAREVFSAARAVSTEDMRGFSRNGLSISALPGTKFEVDGIDALVEKRGFVSKTYLFENAKEEVIKSGVLKDYQYVHFATHGFVNEAIPAYSGVFLSQDETSKEDCILFASEIYNLEIAADLVTLSACETGLGKFAYGEGIVGLTRAFLFAGAKNLLVSQWKVSDASTAKLMVDFYDNILAGKSKAAALREAKLALINIPEFSQPYYWAPFVLIGE